MKRAIAKLRAHEADARKDWAEKTSTDLARRFDAIRVEDLRVAAMTRSARGTATEPGQAYGESRAEPGHLPRDGGCWCTAWRIRRRAG